ncbi:MAG: hypothetical protein ACFFD2_14215 [Promethearchaeota archaeon]
MVKSKGLDWMNITKSYGKLFFFTLCLILLLLLQLAIAHAQPPTHTIGSFQWTHILLKLLGYCDL